MEAAGFTAAGADKLHTSLHTRGASGRQRKQPAVFFSAQRRVQQANPSLWDNPLSEDWAMHLRRIMYIENKSAQPPGRRGVSGPARIGWVLFSNSLQSVYYDGKRLRRDRAGYKWNHFDVENGDRYWISGPRRDGDDGLYGYRATPIDEDAREEYWTLIRRQPQMKDRKFS